MTAKELFASQLLSKQSPTPITPDFFTPNPRRVKGKARAAGVPQVNLLPNELKQECARTWLLDTAFWDRFRFEGAYTFQLQTGLAKIDVYEGLDLDRTVFTYPTRLPRHCTPARAIPSSQRRLTTPRHFSPRIADSPPRPRLFRDSASQYAYASSSASTSHDPFGYLESLIRPLCATTLQKFVDPDKAWEAFLAAVGREDVVMPRRLKPLLLIFATRLADGVFNITSDSPSTPAEEMSSRAAKVRRVLEAITDSSYPPRKELDILETLCMTLEGRLEEVEAILDMYYRRDLSSEDALNATPVIHISQAIAHMIDVLHGPEAAYDWIVSHWQTVEQFLWTKSSLVYSRVSRIAAANLRNTLIGVVEKIKNPADFLAERMRTRPDGPWKNVGEHLIDALCALKSPEEALNMLQRTERLLIPPSVDIKTMLVRTLVKGEKFGFARELYAQVCKETEGARGAELREVWSTGLYLHAMDGNIAEARGDFMRLQGRGWVNYEAITLMLHAFAVKGLVNETVETFEQLFPRAQPFKLKYGNPITSHYNEVLFAHANAGAMDRVQIWLKRMTDDKIIPDAYTYAALLKGFVFSGDVSSLSKLLKRMKSSGVRPDLHGYTILISFLARTGDVVGVERTYRQALKDGIKPDIKMFNALMHAHVQSRNWQGVVDTFSYVKSLPGKRYQPTTATYNTLLKAHVLIGSSLSTISDLVTEQETLGTCPDAHTFALLVQSACDHKEFDLALGLLDHMDRLTGKIGPEVEVTIYVLSILMGSFLKHGDKVRAREMFGQMKSRNIVPTAITYSKIIRAYAQENTSEALQLAEAFMRKLISEGLEDDGLRAGWVSISGGRSLALETLYQPLMHVYAKLRQVEDVERLQQELLDQGGRTTLGALGALLAAYRNEGDVEAGKETWSLIFDMASQRANLADILPDDENESDDRQELIFQSNILCVPLSIYIDLLSSTGHHAEIAKVWDELRTHGFTFDSHNWNHLIIALIRAGEPERAFAILDRVILPNATPASSAGEAESGMRSRQPDSPLSVIGGRNEGSLLGRDESPAEPQAWMETTVHQYNRRMEGIRRVSEHLESHPTIDIGPRGDLAHRLETLQLIPFAWNSWQPHSVTLSVLSHALTHLASGKLLRPIQGDPDIPEISTDESTPVHDSAKVVFDRIYSNYHRAVRAVKDFERQRNQQTAESAEDDEESIRWT